MSKDLENINPIKDKSNPRSIINITPTVFSKQLEAVPESIWEMTEYELKDAVNITPTDEMLRVAFWREYDAAQFAQRKIVLSNIYGGVCSQTHFVKNVVGNSFKLAYVLSLPKDFEVQMTSMLDMALERTREILTLPLTRKDGSFDGHLGNVIHKILETSLDRVKGSVVYRSESKSLNLNKELPSEKTTAPVTDLDEIDRRIGELEARSKGLTDVIEIEAQDEESNGS